MNFPTRSSRSAQTLANGSVIGKMITVDGKPHQVLGVLRQDFGFGGSNLALLLPVKFDRGKTFLLPINYDGIARLRPGVRLAEANADVARMLPIVLGSFPPPPGYSLAGTWKLDPAHSTDVHQALQQLRAHAVVPLRPR